MPATDRAFQKSPLDVGEWRTLLRCERGLARFAPFARRGGIRFRRGRSGSGGPCLLRSGLPDSGSLLADAGSLLTVSGIHLTDADILLAESRSPRTHSCVRRTRIRIPRTDDRAGRISRAGVHPQISRSGIVRRIGTAAIVVSWRNVSIGRRGRQAAGEDGADGETNGEDGFHKARVWVFSRRCGRLHSK